MHFPSLRNLLSARSSEEVSRLDLIAIIDSLREHTLHSFIYMNSLEGTVIYWHNLALS